MIPGLFFLHDNHQRSSIFLSFLLITAGETTEISSEDLRSFRKASASFLLTGGQQQRSGVKAGVEVTARLLRGLMMVPIKAQLSLYFLSHVSQRPVSVTHDNWPEKDAVTSWPPLPAGHYRTNPTARYCGSGRTGAETHGLTDGIKRTIRVS